MMPIDDAPRSFPVEQENTPLRRRAVFSASVAAVDSHHVRPAGGAGAVRGHRRKLDDDSLKLIDDLTNRPMDPLFMDSRLARKPSSPAATWATRVVVFVICVAVGFAGALFVQQLHTDPRRAVRESWASELEDQTSQVEDLTGQINDIDESRLYASTLRHWAKLIDDYKKSRRGGGGGGGGGGGSQSSISDAEFEFMLKLIRMIQQEQDIRMRTRAAEQEHRKKFTPPAP